MTNAERIISEILELDKNAHKAPWQKITGGNWHEIASADDDLVAQLNLWEGSNNDGELIAHYRSSAPKIARALRVAIESLIEWDSMRTLDEIEAILGDENELGKGET